MTANRFGLLNINKPPGMTSRKVVDRVVRLVRPAKAGHAGTLDPLATGVLVVCVGSATRLIAHVQQGRKRYQARFVFGQRSDTDDITGNVSEAENVVPFSRTDLEALFPQFTGRVEQVPPQFSAVHVGGRRAYKLARQGQNVDIKPRAVEIHSLAITRFAFPEVELDIECGSGTYIRSIARDLGEALGCGALMSALTRTAVGPFRLDDAVDLDKLTPETLPAALKPAVTAVAGLPQYRCTHDDEFNLRHGRRIAVADERDWPESDTIAIISSTGRLVCLARYESTTAELAPRQVFPDQLTSIESNDAR